MLVSVYRNGPLRNGLSKGYILVADDRSRVVEALSRDPALRAMLDQHRMGVQTDSRHPAGLWVSTGPVWLATREGRATLLAALADVVSTLANAVGRNGGLLMPSAAQAAARDRWSWLCEDQHGVEVVNERQREICSNLFRRWAPELIALSGRAAFGPATADRLGSRRLADVADQVPARYIASASKLHLERVREALRRDEGVPSLDVTDINPIGDERLGMPGVEVRFVDAQVFPATFISHAVLLQALAMKARQTERDGGRIPAYKPDMLDRNRSRAVASGLSAVLEVEQGRASRGAGSGRDRPEVIMRTAADQVESLIRLVLPELRAMEVTAAELMPLVSGISLRSYYPDAIRTENDLFAHWRQMGRGRLDGSGLHALLTRRDMLAADQITQANTQLTPGGMAVVEELWSGLLQDPDERRSARPDGRGDKPGPGHRPRQAQPGSQGQPADSRKRPGSGQAPRDRRSADNARAAGNGEPPANGSPAQDERRALAEATLMAALGKADARDAAVAAVRRHAAAGWRSIIPALRQVDGEEARQLRRTLRPPGGDVLRLRDSTDIGGQLGKAIMETVFERGDAFVALDISSSERPAALAAVDAFRKSLPPDVTTVLVTNTSFQRPTGQRVSLELLVLDTKGLG